MIDGIKRILYYISRNENTIKEVKNQVDRIQKINSLEGMLEDTDIDETVPEDKDMLLIQKDNTNKSDTSEDTVESTANYTTEDTTDNTTEDTPEDTVSSTEADTTTSEKVCYRISLATLWLYIKTKLSNVLVGGEQTEVSTEDDGVNVFEFTDMSGNRKSFKVKNGSRGSKGDTGPQGVQGPKGDTGPTTTVLSNQDYTVNSSSGHGFSVNNTAKPNSYAKLFADAESGALELGSNGGTYSYQMDCYADSFIRMYCFQRNPWKYMAHWTFDKDGNFSATRFTEAGTALSEKYMPKTDDLDVNNVVASTLDATQKYKIGNTGYFLIENYEAYGLRYTYFTNPQLQILPTKDNVTNLGHSLYRFAEFRCNNIYISSGTAVTSDRRYKENIANLEDKLMLNFVMALTPSSYKYKDGESGRTHYGLIAQDVEKVLENIGLSNKDFAGIVIEKLTKEVETKTVNDDGETVIEKHLEETGEVKYDLRYEEFIAPLIKVVQMQQKNMDSLEERLLKLENKLSGNN